jgi:hypothetical protein
MGHWPTLSFRLWRTDNPQFAVRDNHKTTMPAIHIFAGEYFPNALNQTLTIRSTEPNEQDAVMVPGVNCRKSEKSRSCVIRNR